MQFSAKFLFLFFRFWEEDWISSVINWEKEYFKRSTKIGWKGRGNERWRNAIWRNAIRVKLRGGGVKLCDEWAKLWCHEIYDVIGEQAGDTRRWLPPGWRSCQQYRRWQCWIRSSPAGRPLKIAIAGTPGSVSPEPSETLAHMRHSPTHERQMQQLPSYFISCPHPNQCHITP